MAPILYGFQRVRPFFQLAQSHTFQWLSEAYGSRDGDLDSKTVHKKILRYACPENKVSQRGFFLQDFSEKDWPKRKIFNFGDHVGGARARSDFFQEVSEKCFRELFANNQHGPSDLFHVTCTGYVSPSGAQKLVSEKRWHNTRVTHLYHMGCYGALSAVRLASAALKDQQKTSIVHTELCTLHFDPNDVSPEQVVINSLFSDGVIAYDLSHCPPSGRGLKVYRSYERTLPHSDQDMTWVCSDHGMAMTLSRDVPNKIRNSVQDFVAEIVDQEDPKKLLFAIHPGGPSIIEAVADTLKLDPWQYAHSQKVLFENGNMSSATVPHVWQEIVEENEIPAGTKVVSLAFGPGLTLCGNLLEVFETQ